MALSLDGTTGITSDGGTPVIENLDTTATGIAVTGQLTTTGSLGIGTTSPAAKLAVVGGTSNASNLSTAYSLAAFNITPKSTSGYSLQFGSGPGDLPYIQMSAGGAASGNMTIQPYGGNVGIGTTSISGKLSINGEVYAAAGAASGVAYGFYPKGTYGNTGMFSPAPNTVAFATTGGERVRIDNAGNVGIGTTSPAYRLDVSATGFVSARISTSYSGSGNIRIEDATTTANAPYIGSVGDNLAFGRIGVAEYMRIDSSANLKFNSGYGSVATAYGCRAWVNFNGTGTVSIRASGNVSSITDHGTGNYAVNFTTAMVDTNYNFVTNSSNTNSSNILCIGQLNWDAPTKTTSVLRLYNLKTNNGALTDQDTISVSIFR